MIRLVSATAHLDTEPETRRSAVRKLSPGPVVHHLHRWQVDDPPSRLPLLGQQTIAGRNELRFRWVFGFEQAF